MQERIHQESSELYEAKELFRQLSVEEQERLIFLIRSLSSEQLQVSARRD